MNDSDPLQAKTGDLDLRRLYEATPAMLQSVDADGRMRMVSDSWLARLGYTREEVIGRPVTDFLAPKSAEILRTAGRSALFTKGSYSNLEIQLVCKDGEVFDAASTATLDGPPDGSAQGRFAIIEDLTHRRAAERAMRQELRRLSNVVEATNVGTWEWNVQTGALRVNQRWATILGYTLDELGPVNIQTRLDLLHPDDLPRSLDLLEQHFAGLNEHYQCETRMRHREGHYVWVLSHGTVMARTADGKPEWMFGLLKDISERKGQEEALRKSEELLERTGNIAGVGGWDLDVATGVVTWSAETYRIHGAATNYRPTLDQAIDFYAPAARPVIRAAVEDAIAGGGGWDLELPLIRADGSQIWVRAVGSVTLAGGKPARLSGACQDVTERVAERRALEVANERVILATDSGCVGIWDWDITHDSMTWDPWMYRLYGMETRSDLGAYDLWRRHLHPDDLASAEQAIRNSLDDTHPFDTNFRIVWADGTVHHIRAYGQVTRDDAGRAVRMVGTNWDVTEAYRLTRELAKQNELLRVTLHSIGDGVITADAGGLVTWLNPVAERMTGWSAAEAAGQDITRVFHILHEESRQPAENPVAACLTQGRVVGLADKTVLISRNGEEYGIADSASPIRTALGEMLGIVLVFHDVTEQRRLSGEMSYRATHDALTGLVNRGEFENRLRPLLQMSHADSSESALLYIDLDQFKVVNDTCGHAVGDQLLRHVSTLLADGVRASDTLARLGGDEFGIILDHCGAAPALRLAQRICDRMDDFRFIHDGRRFRIGASVGLVSVDDRWTTPAAVMQAADASCYAAKEAGRNRVHVWSNADQTTRARRGEVQWAARLEHALDDDCFVLFAQRIKALRADGDELHAEVLLRMLGSDGSLMPPGAFLPAAERFHLASRIDRWVLTQAINWLQSIPLLHSFGSLSVNLSGQSIGDRTFHRFAVETLSAAGGLVCAKLCVEITEASAVTNLSDAALFIEQIRALGVRVALDDFGAGSSSFGYLKSMQVDILKIDGQFIRDLVTETLDEAAVRCFVDISGLRQMRTVAEFVESQAVLDKLALMGIDYAQGYLIHRPAPIGELLAGLPGSGPSAAR